MEAYKYDVTVQENGIIQIPELSRFANRTVEVLIMVKPQGPSETAPLQTFDAFLKKWSGVIKGVDPDDLKTQYLQEKYG